jgi:hypothetical protein
VRNKTKPKRQVAALLAGCILLATALPSCAQFNTNAPGRRFTVTTNQAGAYLFNADAASGFYTNSLTDVRATNKIPQITAAMWHGGMSGYTNVFLATGFTNYYIARSYQLGSLAYWNINQVVDTGASVALFQSVSNLTGTTPPTNGWVAIPPQTVLPFLFWQPAGTVTNSGGSIYPPGRGPVTWYRNSTNAPAAHFTIVTNQVPDTNNIVAAGAGETDVNGNYAIVAPGVYVLRETNWLTITTLADYILSQSNAPTDWTLLYRPANGTTNGAAPPPVLTYGTNWLYTTNHP